MGWFGMKKSTPSSGPRDLPENLSLSDDADVKWIMDRGDPLIWHEAALSCLLFVGYDNGLLAWLSRQPTLDRVTASAMFLHRSNGERFLKGEPLESIHDQAKGMADMLGALLDLDLDHVLPDNGIALQDGWESERILLVERLGHRPRFPRFLGHNINAGKASMPYFDLGEGDLMLCSKARDEDWM